MCTLSVGVAADTPAGARGATGQYHRPLDPGGFAPERTRRRAPERDRTTFCQYFFNLT